MTTIGEKIRDLRRQRGMTQAELGQGIVSASMMSQIESGRTRPSYTLLKNIANKLDVPVEYFMNEMEDHFATSARLQLAEFWFLTGTYEKVFEVLNNMDVPEPPGADYFLYRYLLARIYRMQQHYETAVQTLEELREYGLKTVDRRILFSVMKEAGYVEVAMGNPQGAEHEWKTALQLGVDLSQSKTPSTLHLQAELGEICLQLAKLATQANQPDTVVAYVERAENFVQGQGRYKDIAEALVEDGLTSLLEDAGRARNLIDTAVNLIHFNNFIEQNILVQTLQDSVSGALPKSIRDPWEEAAKATLVLHPEHFLQYEVQRVQQLLENNDASVALSRIARCHTILDDYRREDENFYANRLAERIDLKLAEAKAHLLLENHSTAVSLLLQMFQEFPLSQFRKKELEVCKILLNASQSAGYSETTSEVEDRIYALLVPGIRQMASFEENQS